MIGRINARSWQWAYRGHLPDDYLDGIDEQRRAKYWHRTLGAPGATHVFVAETIGGSGADTPQVLGYVQVGPPQAEGPGEGIGELYSIYLLEHAAGRGIGKALMDRGLDALRSDGYHSAILWVLETNARSRRFYERSGWQPDGASNVYELRGHVPAPAVRYRIRL